MAQQVKPTKSHGSGSVAGQGRVGRRRSAESEARAAARRQRRIQMAGLGLVGVVLLVVLGAWVYNQASQPLPGQAMPIQSRDHIAVGAQHPPYNSNPPTSGWHYDTPLAAGIYDTPQVDENLVHSLEHGYIIVSYDCAKLNGLSCDDLKTKLSDLANQQRIWKLIVVPRDNMDAPIALTAWGRIEKLNTYDENSIRAFVSAWRDKGPEQTPD